MTSTLDAAPLLNALGHSTVLEVRTGEIDPNRSAYCKRAAMCLLCNAGAESVMPPY